MSLKALTWAFEQEVRPSSKKFVLVAMADYASETGLCYPTIQTLTKKTCQDRKTIMFALESLEHSGIIKDTLKRVGQTQKTKVYKLIGFLPDNSPENGTIPNGQIVPFFPPNSPVFPTKQSLKRDTEPLLNRKEPLCSTTSSKPRFEKPDMPRMETYAKQIGLPVAEVSAFFDHHEARGWMISRVPMKDWQAAMRTWNRNRQKFSTPSQLTEKEIMDRKEVDHAKKDTERILRLIDSGKL